MASFEDFPLNQRFRALATRCWLRVRGIAERGVPARSADAVDNGVPEPEAPPPIGSVDSKEKASGPPKVKVCSPEVTPVGTTNTMA